MSKKVAIAGGGVAGLSAAVFLADKGFDVSLYESSPKLGGRAYSYFDREKAAFFDNGQHLLAGWYEETFSFLDLIGSSGLTRVHDGLEIDFFDRNKNHLRMKSSSARPPLNLVLGLMKFRGFTVREKLRLLKVSSMIDSAGKSDSKSAEDLLNEFGQRGNLRKYFWDPLILAVFNTEPSNVSPVLFRNVMRIAMKHPKGFSLVIPEVDLNKLFVDPAVEFLRKRNCKVFTGNRIEKVWKDDAGICFSTYSGEAMMSDYFISAIPFFSFKEVLGELIPAKPEALRSSSIVSVHIFLKEALRLDTGNKLGMTGLIGTKTQWLFRKSDEHISLVISGSDAYGITETDNDGILEMCMAELASCITEFSQSNVTGYKVIKEKRATFIPDADSDAVRPGQGTSVDNFFLAGDWTDTGLPSTIEGAVKSGKICAGLIMKKARSQR